MSSRRTTIAIVGATGAVGRTALTVLEERGVAPERLRLAASPRSEGSRLPYGGGELPVAPLTERTFEGVDTALFALDDALAAEWVPRARAAGVTVVDKSATYRLHPEVPLVVPEINRDALAHGPTLVANPNCSTIILALALAPLAQAFGLRRVHAVTFQSASGAGADALAELRSGAGAHLAGADEPVKAFPRPIAFDCHPQVGSMREDGTTREEWKLLHETRRILSMPSLPGSFTCVRVPTFISHAAAVHVETERKIPRAEAAEALFASAPGVRLGDGRDASRWPTPRDAAGRDDVLVGRVRIDAEVENGLQLWVVGDNLRKGAATNAIQIAEALGRL